MASSSVTGTEEKDSSDVDEGTRCDDLDLKTSRLVKWMTELFKTYIRDIVAKRPSDAKGNSRRASTYVVEGSTPLDEVVEVIALANFDAKTAVASIGKKAGDVEISEEVSDLLRDYIIHIARSYKANPFQ